MAAIKTDPQYSFHPWVGTDNQEFKRRVLKDGTVKEIGKKFKRDPIKELARSFCHSIPDMKLAMLDKDFREYLLYSLFSMQYVIGLQLMLLDAFITQTKSNKD